MEGEKEVSFRVVVADAPAIPPTSLQTRGRACSRANPTAVV